MGAEELSLHGSRTGCAETTGTLFLAPALERSVTMICLENACLDLESSGKNGRIFWYVGCRISTGGR